MVSLISAKGWDVFGVIHRVDRQTVLRLSVLLLRCHPPRHSLDPFWGVFCGDFPAHFWQILCIDVHVAV